MKIKTPKRLHFGIIDLSRKFNREYGAFGVTLKNGYEIEIKSGDDELEIEGSEREKKIIRDVHGKLRKKFDISEGFKISIEDSIPDHVGFGSTTQLTLGTAYGILKKSGKEISKIEMARDLERGRFSAIGTHGFDKGGFILEGGKSREDEISPLLKRGDLPEDWRFLIICPKETKGYDEKEEKPIMEELTVEKKYPEKICHNILMGLMPSLETDDIRSFGRHLTKIQNLVGESFSDFQDGKFHPAINDVVKTLIENTHGGGQSSWGPTSYGLVKEDEINEVKEKVLSEIKEEDYRVRIGEPDNEGVKVIE